MDGNQSRLLLATPTQRNASLFTGGNDANWMFSVYFLRKMGGNKNIWNPIRTGQLGSWESRAFFHLKVQFLSKYPDNKPRLFRKFYVVKTNVQAKLEDPVAIAKRRERHLSMTGGTERPHTTKKISAKKRVLGTIFLFISTIFITCKIKNTYMNSFSAMSLRLKRIGSVNIETLFPWQPTRIYKCRYFETRSSLSSYPSVNTN